MRGGGQRNGATIAGHDAGWLVVLPPHARYIAPGGWDCLPL